MVDIDLTVEEALAFADTESRGHTFYPGKRGLMVTCVVLAAEVRELYSINRNLVNAIATRCGD